MNSQAKVPTLVDGDLTLTESAAIVNYAAMKSVKEGLMPRDTVGRARYDGICYFIMTDFEQPLWTIGKHRFALPEAQRCPEIFATAAFEFDKSQKALHQYVDGHAYALGNTFTMADVLLAQTINWAQRFEMDLAPSLIAYRDRMYMRPACVRSLAMVD
jgi:glutathione S-transferase